MEVHSVLVSKIVKEHILDMSPDKGHDGSPLYTPRKTLIKLYTSSRTFP